MLTTILIAGVKIKEMKKFFEIIVKIFQWTFKLLKLIREMFLNIILLLIISASLWMVWHVKNNYFFFNQDNKCRILIINLNKIVNETPILNTSEHNDYYDFFNKNITNKTYSSIFEIANKIKTAEMDPKITGIILKTGNGFSTNQVILEYLGKKIYEFKQSKKPVIAIGNSYSQSEYYLASFADKIFLLPYGRIQLNGFSNKKIYFKNLLNLCKIHIHIFRIGKYKSAVEPYLRSNISKKNKQIDQCIIRCKWKKFLQTIAHNRKVPIKEIYPHPSIIIKRLKANNNNYAEYALHYHLIDHILKKNKIKKHLCNIFKYNKKNNDFNYIDINDYHMYSTKKPPQKKDNISIIIANGIIGDNSNNSSTMNISSILNEIKHAKNDNTIKAVVFRINSPGGSVEGSERIRQALISLRQLKPVIISMGDISASGGYWISTAGNYIVAHSTTITGSIGIFSMIPTLEKLRSMIGINYHGASTKWYNQFNIFNNISIQDKKKIRLNIINGYKKFISIIAQSRNQTKNQIHKIAQGRIWLGMHAIQIGLVDEIGDLDIAIKKAAQLSNIKRYNILWSQKKNTLLMHLKNKIHFSLIQILRNTLEIFFSKECLNKIYIIWNNINSIYRMIQLNPLVSICPEYYI